MPAIWGPIAGAGVGWALQKYGGSGRQAPDVYDPFAEERLGYQKDLRELTHGKFDPTSDPAYMARLEGGTQAINRSAAATGTGGGQLAQLTKYGSDLASSEYDKQFERLATLSGSGISPHISSPTIDTTGQQGLGQLGNLLGRAAVSSFSGGTTPESSFDPNVSYDYGTPTQGFQNPDPYASVGSAMPNYDPYRR